MRDSVRVNIPANDFPAVVDSEALRTGGPGARRIERGDGSIGRPRERVTHSSCIHGSDNLSARINSIRVGSGQRRSTRPVNIDRGKRPVRVSEKSMHDGVAVRRVSSHDTARIQLAALRERLSARSNVRKREHHELLAKLANKTSNGR